jgi:hypothetical protein
MGHVSAGTKATSAAVSNSNDELKQFSEGRITSAAEAMWYVLGYPMHKQSPTVQRLSCTLQYNPQVKIDPDMAPEDIQASVQDQLETSVSHLKSWFILNATDAFARTLTYVELPMYYVWHMSGRWKRRVKCQSGSGAVGRIYPVDPSLSETWALRLLLHHARGCLCESDIRTVRGVEELTFVAAAMAAGILEDDREYHLCLSNASKFIGPAALRSLFLIILARCQPREPMELLDTFFEELVYDWLGSAQQKLQKLLVYISANVETSLDVLGLIYPDQVSSLQNDYLDSYVSNPAPNHQGVLNSAQQIAHDAILSDIETQADGGGRVFTLMAAAGTGKTFLINSILHSARQRNLRVVPCATSALAASLLGHARTSECHTLSQSASHTQID